MEMRYRKIRCPVLYNWSYRMWVIESGEVCDSPDLAALFKLAAVHLSEGRTCEISRVEQ